MVTPKKATPKPTPKPSKPTAPVAAPLAKARVEYQALLREITVAERDELRGWDRKWEAVATVLAKKYFLFDESASTAPEWVKKYAHEEYRTGARYARVATLASPDEEQKYTISKIDLAYTIDEARQRAAAKKRGTDWTPPSPPKKLALDKLRYSVDREGTKVSLGLAEVSVAELRALQSSESRAEGAPAARVSKSARAVIKAIGAERSLREVRVQERDNQLTLSSVRFDQLNALGRVLSALKLDSNE
ncbi:MAG: hypothetical protein Q8Q09_21870 [Deltaproteobacteria bacterium]|nr:hypothetical protein [Deltaproteobacteria bacterium]